ncbi:MAG: hypothetical protein J7K21_01110 [Desulfurococcales archaeon]|nr:hypothetical protein [Desulfurococcales archaeon]
MAFEHLKVKPLQRATASWANAVVDALNQLYGSWKEVYKRGTVEDPWDQFYGEYGYFLNDLFVQGKRVIKDGDPVSIYELLEPAKQDIREAIDQSKVPSSSDVRDIYNVVAREETQRYVKELLEHVYGLQSSNLPPLRESVNRMEETIVKLNIDEYGNVGIRIVEPIDVYGNVKVSPRDIDEDLIPATGIIDTATQTSPVTIITPSPGKRVDVRRAYVATNSTRGEIYVRFKDTGRLITAIFPTKYGYVVLPAIRILGEVDEHVVVEWSGVDSGSKIVYVVNYKER